MLLTDSSHPFIHPVTLEDGRTANGLVQIDGQVYYAESDNNGEEYFLVCLYDEGGDAIPCNDPDWQEKVWTEEKIDNSDFWEKEFFERTRLSPAMLEAINWVWSRYDKKFSLDSSLLRGYLRPIDIINAAPVEEREEYKIAVMSAVSYVLQTDLMMDWANGKSGFPYKE